MRPFFFCLLLALACAAAPVAAFADPAPAAQTAVAPPELLQSPNLADPALTECKETTDCAYITPPCGQPAPINSSHYGAVRYWYDHVKTGYTCPDWVKMPVVKHVMCRASHCAVELGGNDAAAEPAPQIKDKSYCEKDTDCVVVLGACCSKTFVNTESAGRLKAEMAYNRPRCFYPDHRHTKNLRCEKHKCTAELEVPLEL